MRFRGGVIALALAAVAAPGRAWDGVGHQQIADIAWSQLNAKARHNIGAILRSGDPLYRPKSLGSAAIRTAFARASVLPDDIKRDRQTIYESLLPRMNALFWPGGQPPADDREATLCKSWHFYDTALHVPPNIRLRMRPSNLMQALPYALQELARLRQAPDRDRALQAWWLAWIEHLVGDAHQPLHCAQNFAFDPQGDAGGNTFKLAPGVDGKADSLHFYWDSGIRHAIEDQHLESRPREEVTRRWTRDLPAQTLRGLVAQRSVTAWVEVHARIAEDEVYHEIQPGQNPAPAYRRRHRELCRRQAVLAGYRLAALLNGILGR